MSLLLLFSGTKSAKPAQTIDPDIARKLRKKLQERRREWEEQEKRDRQRKVELRQELTNLYLGIEPEKETIVVAKQIIQKHEEPDFAKVIGVLSGIQRELQASQRKLIVEYREIELRERIKREQDDDDELTIILTAIL